MAKNLQSPKSSERAPVDFSQWLIAKLYSLPMSDPVRRPAESASKATVSKAVKSIIVRGLAPHDPLGVLSNKEYLQEHLPGGGINLFSVWPAHCVLGSWDRGILSRTEMYSPIWVIPHQPKKHK